MRLSGRPVSPLIVRHGRRGRRHGNGAASCLRPEAQPDLRGDADELHRPALYNLDVGLHGDPGLAEPLQPVLHRGRPDRGRCRSDPFKTWHKAWWDNLAVSIQLHQVKRVVGLCHRDCGAAALAYGDKIKTDPAFETAKLSEALRAFRAEVKKRHGVDADLAIMGVNGAVQTVT